MHPGLGKKEKFEWYDKKDLVSAVRKSVDKVNGCRVLVLSGLRLGPLAKGQPAEK